MKRIIHWMACAALVVSTATAQDGKDVLVLNNGDRMTGKVVTFADGSVTFNADMVGDVAVPLENISNLTTAGPVTLVTKNGESYSRRIAGLQDGSITMAGDGPNLAPLPLASLGMINPPPKPPAAWTGSVNLGAYLFTGNTERRGVNSAASAQRRTKIDRISASAAWDYAEDRDASVTASPWNLSQRRLTGGLQYDYFLSDASYVYLNTRLTGDTQADIQLRSTVGAGYGHQWVEREDLAFNTEVGVSYVSENYRSATPTAEYLAIRVAYNLMVQLSEGLLLLQDVEAFPSTENSRDVLAKANTRLQMSLTESMFAELKWELDYDNTPSPGLDRLDHRIFATLGWTF